MSTWSSASQTVDLMNKQFLNNVLRWKKNELSIKLSCLYSKMSKQF